MYCGNAYVPTDPYPALKRLSLFLAKGSTDLLAGISGAIEPAPLHDANMCILVMAYLSVSASIISQHSHQRRCQREACVCAWDWCSFFCLEGLGYEGSDHITPGHSTT